MGKMTLLRRAALLLVGMLAVACGSSATNPAAPTPAGATVTAVAVTGASTAPSFQLTAMARMSDGSAHDVTRNATWESSATHVATVTSTGLVTVVGNGDVDLRATYQGIVGALHASFNAPKTFILSGEIVDASPGSGPVVGARVQMLPGDHTFTDAHGAFSFGGLSAGRTIFEVSKDQYQIVSREVMIDHDMLLPAITLYPSPPKNADGASATARCNDGSWSWAQTAATACTANGGIAYAVCPGPLCVS